MAKLKENRFWMVWSPSGRGPTHKHYSRKMADQECERLARINPSQQFFVLKCVGGKVAASPKLTPIKMISEGHPEYEIPF